MNLLKADNTFQYVPFCQKLNILYVLLRTWSHSAGYLKVAAWCMLSTWLLPVALTIASIVTESHQASVVWSNKKVVDWELRDCCKKQPTKTTLKQLRYWAAFKFINAPEHGSDEEHQTPQWTWWHVHAIHSCEDERCRLFHLNPPHRKHNSTLWPSSSKLNFGATEY